MSFDLSTAISSIAPTLATMLAGPLAGTAVTALEGCFGLSAGSGVPGITAAIQAGQMTPEIVAAMRAADQHHAEAMGQQGIDLVRLNADHDAAMETSAVADRDSARKLQIAKPSPWPGLLTALLTVAVIGVIAARMTGMSLPSDPVTVQLIGSLTTGWGLSLAYWFGTTRGSQETRNLLAQSAPTGVAAVSISSTTGGTAP
jgi:hypothetical protein